MEEMTDREMLVAIYGGVEHIKGEVKELKNDVSELKDNVSQLNMRVGNLEADVAEGHTDIIRKFDDYVAVENGKEMFSIRLNILETDVRNIKEKIGIE